MNHRAKLDAASYILAGKIRNRTNTNKQTNKQKPRNDISTPCLSARVDNKELVTCVGDIGRRMCADRLKLGTSH